jgi:flagellar basal-body rod protein FlgB
MTSKLDNHFLFHTQALNVRTERQQLIAANIANADTPHYKARDVDFGQALQAALAGRGAAGLEVARTAPGHLSSASNAASMPLFFRGEAQSAVDGNTVDMDVERAQFADNAIRYEAGLTFVTGRFKGLLDAMQGPRG